MKERHIFIAIYYKTTSGGAESLHQLGKVLVERGYDAHIVYINGTEVVSQEIHEKFSSFGLNSVDKILDISENILVVPEISLNFLDNYHNIKRVIWFLSWDFYYKYSLEYHINYCMSFHHIPFLFKSITEFYFLWREKNKGFFKIEKYKDSFVLYNCEYVRNELLKRGMNEEHLFYLCGPISDIYFDAYNEEERKDVVLYNPAKDNEFAKKIFQEPILKNLKLIPIVGMTPHEICKLMRTSKLYIDFGDFPGPERMPREAVISGCCIITSKNGAAANDEDVKIGNEYKFEKNDLNLREIAEKILYVINNYGTCINDFSNYKNKVITQKNSFENNIVLFFKSIFDK